MRNSKITRLCAVKLAWLLLAVSGGLVFLGCEQIESFLAKGGEEEKDEPYGGTSFVAYKTYYVKADGDNTNDGSATAPFQTVAQALGALAADYIDSSWPYKDLPDAVGKGAIVILGTVESPPITNITGTYPPLILSGESNGELKLNEKGRLLKVGTNGTLILKGITLQGRTDNNEALVDVDGGHLIIENGARITGNISSGGGGGIHSAGAGRITMNDGEISGNKAGVEGGGGIFIDGPSGPKWDDNETPFTFTMNGGVIRDNEANVDGGGVVVYDTTVFTMNGGEVSGNKAGADGGGVYVDRGARFLMTGGTIKSNQAVTGGGVAMKTYGDAAIPSTFSKIGGTIYGDDDTNYSSLSDNNTSTGGKGHAVYVHRYENDYVDKAVRNTTAGKNDVLVYSIPALDDKTGAWE
jgi:hypothetical protein